MTGFIFVRFGRALLTLWAVLTFTFIVMRLTGDPASQLLPDNATEEIIQRFRARWGLDQSIFTQYLIYMKNLLQFDFGVSIANSRPALVVALERVPATLQLTTIAFALTLALGLPAGIICALNRGKWPDQALMMVSTLGYSLPNFVLGIALVYIFALAFRLLPSSGSATAAHLVLPVITLGFSGAAVIARFTRAAVLDVLEKPYICAAMAGGESYRATILRHVLPNAAIPVVTIIGFTVGGLIGGSIIVEQVFAWPGIGRLLVDTVGMRDFAVTQTLVMIFAVAMTAANLIVDILYGFLNPRMQGGRNGRI
ncbi:ABC transporter permease [Chelativorans sp. AA-79]|uniref:ABC transporter permease n=1 Tax=Chelativorans sp. AA-79 TaxID=3028735 RepID=UPI0023F7E8FA|nr:ABC transporter permease [Chelativorans sp. AA-79]WEX08662.1 ABC transporter permease [Chelativorans sp. AA-79]